MRTRRLASILYRLTLLLLVCNLVAFAKQGNQNVTVQYGIQISGAAPTVTLNPASLSFGNQTQGTNSASQPITLTNTGPTAPLAIGSITISLQYSQTNNCPGLLAVNSNCTINVTFSPTATGSIPGTLTIVDNGLNSPQLLTLSGIGISSGGNCPITCNLGWTQLSNTAMSAVNPGYADIQGTTDNQGFPSWSGGLMDTRRNRLAMHGGGHGDYYGNEIYGLNFTGTPAPQLVKDASHGAQISNVQSTPEAYTDGSPSGRHTYNGFLFLPNNDRYFLFGAFRSAGGNSTNVTWLYDPSTSSNASGSTGWTQLLNTGPNQAQNGSVPLTAYDYPSDTVFEIENGVPNFWSWSPVSLTWTLLNGSARACPGLSGHTDNTAAIDSLRRFYYCVGGGGNALFWKVSLDSPYTETDLSGAPGCSALTTSSAPGFAWDPVHQDFVGWISGNSVVTFDPVANSCTTLSTFTGGPTTVENGTWGRWQYNPALGGFVLYNDAAHNGFFFKRTDQVTAAARDYLNRQTAAGVTASQNFDSAATFHTTTSGGGFWLPLGATIFDQDTTVARSGTGSAHCGVPMQSSDQPCGWYALPFGFNLTPGTSVEFSFAQRVDQNYISEQAPANGGGFTYWKQFIVSFFDGGNVFKSCQDPDLVLVDAFSEGYPFLYEQCGALGFQLDSALAANGHFNEWTKQLIQSGTYNPGTASPQVQPSLTGGAIPGLNYNCQYNGSTTPPATGCAKYVANTWTTYKVRVDMGTFGSPNSTVQAWVSTPTAPAWQQILYAPQHTILQGNVAWFLNVFQVQPYWTERNPNLNTTPALGTAHTWYDELIISTKWIAPPMAPPALP